MPKGAKWYYLFNLIPLWRIDEKDIDVDWPLYHAYFGDLIDMRADIKNRKIRWIKDNGATVDPELRIRFEVYESDFLLSGGLDDWMGTYSSNNDFGKKVTLRPIKIVSDVNNIPEEDREKYIFIHWINGQETTVTASDDTSTTKKILDILEVRCWWKVTEEKGGDVSGSPEYYYDVFVEGKLENGEKFDLHERSDRKLEGLVWNWANKLTTTCFVYAKLFDSDGSFVLADMEYTIHGLSSGAKIISRTDKEGILCHENLADDLYQVSVNGNSEPMAVYYMFDRAQYIANPWFLLMKGVHMQVDNEVS